MEVKFDPQALDDIQVWKRSGKKSIQKKISELLHSILATPFSGIGHPEPLRGNLSGFWSREITKKDRLVYKVFRGYIYVYSLRGHYDDK